MPPPNKWREGIPALQMSKWLRMTTVFVGRAVPAGIQDGGTVVPPYNIFVMFRVIPSHNIPVGRHYHAAVFNFISPSPCGRG